MCVCVRECVRKWACVYVCTYEDVVLWLSLPYLCGRMSQGTWSSVIRSCWLVSEPQGNSSSASSALELWAVSTLACFVLMWFWEVLTLACHTLCLLGDLSGLNCCFGYWTQVLVLVYWALYCLSHSPSLCVLFVCFVETGSHVAQIGLKLLLYQRLVVNSWPSCLSTSHTLRWLISVWTPMLTLFLINLWVGISPLATVIG